MSKKEKPLRTRKTSHPAKLHKRMVLSVSLVIFIITSLFGFFTHFSAKKHMESIASDLHKNNTKHIISLVEEKIYNYTSSLEAISKLNTITDPEIGWNNKVNILLHEKDKLDYIDLGIADAHGNLTLSNGEVVNISNNEYFQKSIEGETFISKPFVNPGDQNAELVALSTPLVHADETVGILVGFQSSNEFKKNIESVGLGLGKEVHLLSSDDATTETSPLKYTNWNIRILPEEISLGNLQGFVINFFAFIVLSLIIGFIVSNFIISWTIEPLIDMIKTMTSIANLDFSKNINRKYLRRKDQIGQIGQDCQDALSNLRIFVSKISKASGRVANTASELAFVSNLTALSTTNFAQSAASIFDNRKIQMQKILNSIYTIKEISSKLEHISNHSTEINKLIQDICDKTYLTEKEFNKYEKQIKNINFYISHANEICTKFESNSKEMATITKTMKNTMNQANSITLNAAIEASKVDEQGKSFTVIAEEFDKLREETHLSTKNLYNLIGENKQLIDNAYELIEYQQRFINNGQKKIINTKNISTNITSLIEQISKEIHNMTIAISYITEETLDIVDFATNIEDIHAEITYREEDVSTITSEQTISVEEISAAGKALARSADNLQKLIDCIKV